MFFLNLKYFLSQFRVGQSSYLHECILSHIILAGLDFGPFILDLSLQGFRKSVKVDKSLT